MESSSSGLTLHGLPEPSSAAGGGAADRDAGAERAVRTGAERSTDEPDRPVRLPDDEGLAATRWRAGATLPASRSGQPAAQAPGSAESRGTGRTGAFELIRGEGSRHENPRRWPNLRAEAGQGGPTGVTGPSRSAASAVLPDAEDRMVADRRRRFVLRSGAAAAIEGPGEAPPVDGPPAIEAPQDAGQPGNAPAESTDGQPGAGPAASWVDQVTPITRPEPTGGPLTPTRAGLPVAFPEPTDEPTADETEYRAEDVAENHRSADDLLPLSGGYSPEPEDLGPDGPFGGIPARDYHYAVADRVPRAIRQLLPAPPAPEGRTASRAIESGRRRTDLEIHLQWDRLRREAAAAETAAAELRRQAALARDEAYESRATWQWLAHRRSAIADDMLRITAEANTYAEEQRRLSEQARRALRDVSAWDAWIGRLRDEAQRLTDEGNEIDAEAAHRRAAQGADQAAELRDWLSRAERRFRRLGEHLEELSARRDAGSSQAVEFAARQQLLVDRYQRLGVDAQRMDAEAAVRTAEAVAGRVDARERLIDLTGMRPELYRWISGSRVALVRDTGRHAAAAQPDAPGSGTWTRRYDVPPGHRRPLLSEHQALEQALPRNEDGSFVLAPEPDRSWLTLINGIGRRADASRAQNSVETTLALLETYVAGHPRVAAARGVDTHRSGTTRLPLRADPQGRARIETATDGSLQLLFSQTGPEQSRFEIYQVHAAFDTIGDQLKQAGHGSFAVIVTSWQDREAHAWAAVNHQGAVRWLDPQLGVVEDSPVPAEWVRTLEAVLVDGEGRPVPFPGLALSPWTVRPASPDYVAATAKPAPAGFPPLAGQPGAVNGRTGAGAPPLADGAQR